jgi:hypothetical protein
MIMIYRQRFSGLCCMANGARASLAAQEFQILLAGDSVSPVDRDAATFTALWGTLR